MKSNAEENFTDEQLRKLKDEILEFLDLRQKIKELKKRKKSLETNILSFFEEHNFSSSDVPSKFGGGELVPEPVYKKTESVKRYKKALYSVASKQNLLIDYAKIQEEYYSLDLKASIKLKIREK